MFTTPNAGRYGNGVLLGLGSGTDGQVLGVAITGICHGNIQRYTIKVEFAGIAQTDLKVGCVICLVGVLVKGCGEVDAVGKGDRAGLIVGGFVALCVGERIGSEFQRWECQNVTECLVFSLGQTEGL